jgi:hypothetical protein
MHFTVTLRGENTFDEDYSYGLVFNPMPIWVKGKEWLIAMDGPKYSDGNVRRLLEVEGLTERFEEPKSATITVHAIGLGSTRDYTTLIGDLEAEGFRTITFE